jgi:hypothetical protein
LILGLEAIVGFKTLFAIFSSSIQIEALAFQNHLFFFPKINVLAPTFETQ